MKYYSFFLHIPAVFFGILCIFTTINTTSFAGGAESSFSDISEHHELYEEIHWVYNKGIVKGYSDGTFRSNQTITRAEFVKMLILSKYASWGIDRKEENHEEAFPNFFSDIQESDWFNDYVYFAQKKDIIGGYPDGTFRPHTHVNFAESAKIIHLLHFPEINAWTSHNDPNHFQWYAKHIMAFQVKGINTYAPDHLLTRGEMAKILYDLYAYTASEFPPNTSERENELEDILVKLKTGQENNNPQYNFVKKISERDGKTLYIASLDPDGPAPNTIIYFYTTENGIEIVGNQQEYPWAIDRNEYNISFGASLPEKYQYPDQLKLSNNTHLNQNTWLPFSEDSTLEINPYLLKTGIIHPEYGEIFTDEKHALILRGDDFVSRKYSIDIPFLEDGQIAHITWNNHMESGLYDEEYRKGYTYQDQGGCGSKNYASVITSEKPANAYTVSSSDIEPIIYINPETDLSHAGTGINGEDIYELTDPFHPFLLEMYEIKYFEYSGEKISYDTFLSVHPVFFWKDPFGRWIKFESNRFIPQAECGKPVVYLYPEEETQVHVQVKPKGGFSITIPEHGEHGWSVIARPDGSLTEISTGDEYPYLFWEGKGGIYESPQSGWVIPKTDADFFVAGKLRQFGFNTQEIIDFLEFWSPRLQEGEHDFLWIGFWGTQYMNTLAPITITPKPDSILRVLMDYKEVPKWYKTQGYTIPPFQRKGFVVTEWGGTLWK